MPRLVPTGRGRGSTSCALTTRGSEAWDDAVEVGTQRLEDEAIRRATEGWEEPVYQRGELVGHVRRYSDALLMFLLRGRRPEVYGERRQRVEVTGAGGGPIELEGRPRATLADAVKRAHELGLLDGLGLELKTPRVELPSATSDGVGK
jgi:hypothetical protein